MTQEKEQMMDRKMSTMCLDSKFDEIMEQIGFKGKFQKTYNILYNFFLVMCVSMPFLNIVLALAVPDHWCHVPGRNNTNYTIEEWKNLTVPKERDIKGKETLSKCKMYNISDFDHLDPIFTYNYYNVVECQHGWEFDKTWYKETAPSEGNWVCEKELFVTNAFAFGRVGDVVGTFTFGQLGDTIGRKPVFYATIVVLFIGRILSAFSAHNYKLFLFSVLLGSLTSTAVFQAPLIIAMEMSAESKRAQIAMLQCIAWTFGLCMMPFILWAWGHWFHFMLTTTLPCILFFMSHKYIIESPRWLASQGKIKRCIKELEKIAKVNGTKVPDDAYAALKIRTENTEKVYGIMSLFTSFRLAKNTILIIFAWISGALIYYIIILNVTSLGGNPFLNFFYLAIVELPAYVLAKYFCDKIGRRWSQVIPNLFGFIGFIIMVLLINDHEMELIISLLYAMMKFVVAFVFYGSNLQTLEIYPTSVRQTGISLANICASASGIVGPYIVYLGTSYDSRYPPIILAILCLINAICASLLPETLHKKLPETLADAHKFGADQKFWSWPKQLETKTEKVEPILKK